MKREFTAAMARKLKSLRIRSGSGKNISLRPEDHTEICIMEALAIITGQSVTDHPVCVSETVISEMIEINDGLRSDRKRARLKALIPTIMGTCSIRQFKNGNVVRQRSPEYRAAEKRREEVVTEFSQAFEKKHPEIFTHRGAIRWDDLTFNEIKGYIETLVAA